MILIRGRRSGLSRCGALIDDQRRALPAIQSAEVFERRSVARRIVAHHDNPLDLDAWRLKTARAFEQVGYNARILRLDLAWRDGRDYNIGQTLVARTKTPVRDQIAQQVADSS